MVHVKDDPVVGNSLLYANSPNAKRVFSEILHYDGVGHGFGLVYKTATYLGLTGCTNG